MRKSRSSSTESAKGPSEEELKILRAKFHNRFHKFSNALETGGIRIKTNNQQKSKTVKKRKSIWDEEFAPTVFEEIDGVIRPAPTRMYYRDMKPKKAPISPGTSEERVKKRRSARELPLDRSGSAKKVKSILRKSQSKTSSSDTSNSDSAYLNVAKREKRKKRSKRSKEAKGKIEKKPEKTHVVAQPVVPVEEDPQLDHSGEREPELIPVEPKSSESESPQTPNTPLTSGEYSPSESRTAVGSIDVSLRGTDIPDLPPGGVPRVKSPDAISDGSMAKKKAHKEEIKKVRKDKLFEELSDDIQLDDKVLQEIAEDLKKGKNYDSKLIDQNMANKILEAEKAPTEAEMKIKQAEEYEKNEVATKIVNSLTHSNVLGKVLTPNESKILSQYFSGEVQLTDEVLNVLNTALEKIIDRAPEFYDNKEEIKKFVANRDSAKKQLLDALLSRKAGFLKNLYSNAFFYADMISKGFTEAVRFAGVAKDGLAQGYAKSVSVMNEGYSQGKDAINKTYAVGLDVAQQASEYKNRYYAPAASLTKDFVEMARKEYTTEEEDEEKRKREKKVWDEAGWLKRSWWFVVKVFVVLSQDTSMHRRIGEPPPSVIGRGSREDTYSNEQLIPLPTEKTQDTTTQQEPTDNGQYKSNQSLKNPFNGSAER